MITFYFHKNNTLLGKIIRFVSNGNYNHVSIGVNDYIYESNPATGVTKKAADNNYNETITWVHMFDLDEEEVIYFLEGQLGKKYDLIGALSFIWVFLKPRIGFWYCSELAYVALMKGMKMQSCDYDQKQSPQDLYYQLKLLLNK